MRREKESPMKSDQPTVQYHLLKHAFESSDSGQTSRTEEKAFEKFVEEHADEGAFPEIRNFDEFFRPLTSQLRWTLLLLVCCRFNDGKVRIISVWSWPILDLARLPRIGPAFPPPSELKNILDDYQKVLDETADRIRAHAYKAARLDAREGLVAVR
jgi:hypothetical protein